jgi:DNA-binding NarL/FixJ family response regulator
MAGNSDVRVAIVDDNPQFGEALSVLLELEPDVRVVALLDDGERAVEHAASDCADVYLVDFRLPGMNGAETTAAVLAVCAETSVIALSAAVAEPEAQAVLEAGALECLSKDRDLDALVASIRAAAAHKASAEA